MMALNVAFSLAFFIFLYKFVPLLLTSQIKAHVSWLNGQFTFSLIDGIIRLAIFLTVLGVISRLRDIRRVFEYHGAEHKVVFNYESGKPVSIPEAQKFVTFHPRCGTSFLMVVMLISILVYALVPYEGFAMQFAARIVLLPVMLLLLGVYGLAVEFFLTRVLFSLNRYRRLRTLLPDYRPTVSELFTITETDRMLFQKITNRVSTMFGGTIKL